MVRRMLLVLALGLGLAMGSASFGPARAGNMATVELDAPLRPVEAGVTVTIGFTMLQHGIRPVEDGTPALEATHRGSGAVVSAEGRPEGEVGHYVVEVIFPESGDWVWTITPHPFPTPASFPTLSVVAPGQLGADPDGERVGAAIVPRCGGPSTVVYDLADFSGVAEGLDRDEVDAAAILRSESVLPLSLAHLIATRPAIVAGPGVDVLACGQILGQPMDGELIVGLSETAGSGYVGIARITEEDGQSIVAVYLVPGLTSASQPPIPGATVVIEGSSFGPAMLEVAAGTTVSWVNNDAVKHEVAFDAIALDDSGLLDRGQTFSQTFSVPGIYAYACGPHAGMQGTVVVR